MSKRKSEYSLCPNCQGPYADGRSMSMHRLSCQSMMTTWDSFPQGKQTNEQYASQQKTQTNNSPTTKDCIRRNKKPSRTGHTYVEVTPFIYAIFGPNSTEYILPVSDAGPVHGIEPYHEINLPRPPDNKIKYDGQLTPALLYQIRQSYNSVYYRESRFK
mgnify:CR=1 FL=1